MSDVDPVAKPPVVHTIATPSTPKAIDATSVIVKAAASPSPAPLRIRVDASVDDPVEVAEALFRQIDRNGDGSVSQVELVKALRNHSEVAEVMQPIPLI